MYGQRQSQPPPSMAYLPPQQSNFAIPPYPGAPPIPSGVSVNPKKWQEGKWQFNPGFQQNRNSQQQSVPWIPSHHWTVRQHQQPRPQQPQFQSNQQPSFNPYKRVPRPPSAEYWASKLSENPLGLSNMTPAPLEEYYSGGKSVEAHTPWIWRPAELPDDSEDIDDPSSASNHSSSLNKQGEEPESFTAKMELKPTFSTNIVRTPEFYRKENKNNNSNTSSPTQSRGSHSSIDTELSYRTAQVSLSSSRLSSFPFSESSPTNRDFPGTSTDPILSESFSEEPDTILSPLLLGKTPLPAASLSMSSARNQHPNPILATYSLDVIPEAPSSRYDSRSNAADKSINTQAASALQHSQTMPNPPKTQLSYPPSSQRPPPKNREREKELLERGREREDREYRDRERDARERERERVGSRYTTYYDQQQSHSKTTSSSSPSNLSSSHQAPRPSSTHTSPHHNSVNTTTPPSHQAAISPRSSNYSHISNPTLSSNYSHITNPIPSSGKTRPAHIPPLPIPTTPPPEFTEKKRRGFWNRRGDHLTQEGYIVYCPSDKVYPSELRTYPLESEGYQDHKGIFTLVVPRPELPESLPKEGKPPECPYDSFVVYEYR